MPTRHRIPDSTLQIPENPPRLGSWNLEFNLELAGKARPPITALLVRMFFAFLFVTFLKSSTKN
jgi:hypothetical protein